MFTIQLKTGVRPQVDIFDLPWHLPLEEWPDDRFVRLPRGRHRHVVRFVEHDGQFFALKELPDRLCRREYRLLDELKEVGLPVVDLVGIATERQDFTDDPLEGILITRHLPYALPYRILFQGDSTPTFREKLIDALVVLLVRLHLAGFFWGDCSLSNALFRRDAGQLRAYLVDTETGELHESLSDGQRAHELEIASENVAGGILDLQAAGRLSDDIDPATVVEELVGRYEELWSELTRADEIPAGETWRIDERLGRLNDLGFDTDEIELAGSPTGAGRLRFRPLVVEEGHHARELARLTGIEAQENQARRLLNAMRGYGAYLGQLEGRELPEAVVAYRWLTERWEPTQNSIPEDQQGKLEPAEIYHQVLEHVWYLSEQAGHEVDLLDAIGDYVDKVLAPRPDESTLIVDTETAEIPVIAPDEVG